MKVSELTGDALNWAVAQAEGNVRLQYDSREGLIINNVLGWIPYRPSVAWQQGGPIIEREKIAIVHISKRMAYQQWAAGEHEPEFADEEFLEIVCGPTPLVAAMRCYVMSKLGEEIETPEELLK